MHKTIFMNLQQADFSDRAWKKLAIKEDIYKLDFVKIEKVLPIQRIPLKINWQGTGWQ